MLQNDASFGREQEGFTERLLLTRKLAVMRSGENRDITACHRQPLSLPVYFLSSYPIQGALIVGKYSEKIWRLSHSFINFLKLFQAVDK